MTYPNQDFRVGDNVYLLHKDVFGKVVHLDDDRYCVKVEYEFNGYEDYDYFDQRGFASDNHGIPFLYHDRVDISEAPKRKFAPTLVGKTVVITYGMKVRSNSVVIGKVEFESENTVKLEGKVAIAKSIIKSIHDLGEEIKL